MPESTATIRSETLWRQLASHAVEIVFTIVIGAAGVLLFRNTSNAYFRGDDWGLIFQAGSVRGIVRPYNDHLSLAILALYRSLSEVVGFSYGPFRVAGVLCLLGVPVTYFATTRRLLGPPLAAVAALSMLGLAHPELAPSSLNHYLVLIGAIGCSAAWHRGRRADWVLAACLALSLSAAGGGLAVAGACVVYSACARVHRRRWIVVLVPCLAWGTWWFLLARGTRSQFRPTTRPAFDDVLKHALEVMASPFEHLSMGIPGVAVTLALLFCAVGVWRLRQGMESAANFLAWTTALVIWAIGVAYGRGSPAMVIYFRYQLLALGFVLLALLPRKPIEWPPRVPLATDRRWMAAAACLILLASAARGVTLRDEVEQRSFQVAFFNRNARAHTRVLALGPEVVPDDTRLSAAFSELTARDIRGLLRRYGHGPRDDPQSVDRALIDEGVATAQVRSRRRTDCTLDRGPIDWLSTDGGPLRLWSAEDRWTVEVRRFGNDWIALATASAGQKVTLTLPDLGAKVPWQVRADGACKI
ncbi:MAG: hypothetical protein EXQ71_04135 [Acidimicrobiia bacterium]|nr:hypothetical protein [Acidimicrobiia bacterium]